MPKLKSKNVAIQETHFLDSINPKISLIISLAIILIAAIYLFTPYLFDDLRPTGADVVASKGETNLYLQWQEKTGERALWNPNIFAGMPIYSRIIPQIIHIDTLINKLNKHIYWAFLYFLIGAYGIFFLLRYKKIQWYVAVIISLAFLLLPDWQALLGDGHYTKLRAIMVLPWVILSFNFFFDKKSWFGAVLFGLIFSWMFRTQHFQIVFYAILILAFMFVYPYIKLFIDKNYKAGILFTVQFITAIILTVITSAQPFLSMREYAPYSTRGGNPVVFDEKQNTAKESGGVSLDYAIQWSLAPAEVIDFFIQRFHGGISGETYDGEKYPEYKGQKIPGYWGQKPFSGNYHFFGITLFIFVLIGIIQNKKNGFVISLAVFSIFSLLLSFGEDLTWLYKIFYYYVPYFSKFRAPSMIANVTFISFLILSGFGITSFLQMTKNDIKKILIIAGSIFVIGVGIYLFRNSFTYAGMNDSKIYKPEVLNILIEMRKEFLESDVIKMLITTVISFVLIFAFVFRKIRKEVFIIGILAVVFFELNSANRKAFEKINLNHVDLVEQNVFAENDITKYLQTQQPTSRLLVLGSEFQSNHYSYFYPTLNGYSAIKMQTIQDANDFVLFGANTPENINWSYINMMGAKFLVLDGRIQKDFLVEKAVNASQVLYENLNALPKAWFVKNVTALNDNKEIILKMKDVNFSPSEIAYILDKNLQGTFTSEGSIKLIDFSPNKILFEVSTNSKQFMVISEMFYPKGWTAEIDGNKADIIKTNFLIRGLPIPAGNHKVEMKFHPDTYFMATSISWIGNIVSLLALIGFGYVNYFRKRK